MTAKKSKAYDFELNEEFQAKYPEFTRIYTMERNLVLEHFKAGLIISKYYSDDITKTINTLRETFLKESGIDIEFTDNTANQFLRDFARLLGRRLLEDVQKEETEARGEQQQMNSIQVEIEQLRQQHLNITSAEWISTLQDKYQNLQDVVKNEMPEIWPSLEFELSISRILNIGGCDLPFIGIILGRPSSYKTVVIELLKKWPNAYFTDNFTARSFVSHSTSVDLEQLEEIDMLPRIRNKTFLTPELSPMFTTKEEDLTQLLGIITRIADGHGYSSDSGAHGHRGYDEDMMFVWVGAAVDIPWKVYKILNNLGHRLYYFRTEFPEETIEDLTKYASIGEDFKHRRARVQAALFDYLKWFEICPNLKIEPNDNINKKMEWDYSKDDEAAIKTIAGMADVLSYLRCVAQVWETPGSQGSDYTYTISQREVPRRATTALSNLARGRALLNGRNYITLEDVPIVVKTAMDSAQIERVSMFNLLIAHCGKLTTTQILQSLNVARKTVLRTMTELKAIGLIDIEDFHEPGQNNISKRMVLNPRLEWMLTDSVITKFFPHTKAKEKESVRVEEQQEEKEQDEEDITSIFWSVFERLENGNGGTKIVNHKMLHEALVSSGRFYVGDATQIIDDMVRAGSLEMVSFHSYKRI